MQPVACSHCGAPPKGPITPDAQGMYVCAFCGKPSYVGSTASSPSRAPAVNHNWADHIASHDHDDDDDDDHYDDDDDDDDEPPPRANTAEVVAKTAHRLSWVVWMVVVFAIAGGGVGIARCTKGSTLLSSLVWDGKEPLLCSGNDKIAVTGVTATFNAGAAIVATGNCEVRCEGCNVTAPTVVEASGNAAVFFINGTATGSKLLADASGGARVTFTGNVTTSGKIKEGRAGQVSAPTPAAPSAEPAKSAAAVPAAADAPKAAAPASTTPKSKTKR